MHCWAWKLPAEPVKPCTMILESLLSKMDIFLVPLRGRHGLLRGFPQTLGRDDRDAGVLEQLAALLDVGALQADDQGHLHLDLLERGEDARRDHVALHDAAEDVDQHGL